MTTKFGTDTYDGASALARYHAFTCNGAGVTRVATSGDDVLIGGPGADICDGGAHGQGDTARDCEQVTGIP